MIKNLGKLAGRTVFITGASRGIGKEIALKCASDGANIVIAAKTTVPHPKLPGTIYSAAKELEDAGGRCLPCETDIRDEEQVKRAVDQAVARFGGIDILINNASAIHITGTVDTPMKRFDLMMGVNTRGTFLCSKYCIPHLKKSKNPHILNISPPLSMKARWFKDHVAYTMAKFGMSMCALGMAEELREDGIAVNTLWPQTAIYTAAMEMLGGGPDVKLRCRNPVIMSDAAYVILTKDSRSTTGQFFIDEDILRKEGVTTFEKYNYVANPDLMTDFFIDDADVNLIDLDKAKEAAKQAGAPAGAPASSAPLSANPELSKTLEMIRSLISPELVQTIAGVFAFDLKEAGLFYLDLKNASGGFGSGAAPSGKADVTMTLGSEEFVQMFAGKLNPTSAFMQGKLKIKGDLGLAMKLEKLMKQTQSKL